MSSYERTRQQLHTLAEWVLAGPQWAASHTIRLRVIGPRIATVSEPDIMLTRHGLNHDGWYVPYTGTVDQVAASAGLVCRRPDVSYHDPVPGGPETELDLDPDALNRILHVFCLGADALAAFAPAAIAVLWPEHFDLAIRLDHVNYGVSPGDRFSAEPYAYVGPKSHGDDPFWNAPFGALQVIDPDAEGAVAAIVSFFQQGRSLLGSTGP